MKNWQANDIMSGEEFARTFARLKMSQAGAGRYLGFSERTASRVVEGKKRLRRSEVLLLRALLHYKVEPLVPVWVSPRTGKPGTK